MKKKLQKKRRRAKFNIQKLLSLLFILALIGGIIVFAVNQAKDYTPVPITVETADYSLIPPDETVIEIEPVIIGEDDGEPHAAVFADDSSYIDINLPEDGVYPIDTTLQSAYVIVYDVTDNRVLFAKSADKKCFPASTTKLLTASVLLDVLPGDFLFTVGDELELVSEGSSLAMLQKGNVLDMPDMIDALMLPSGNDAAYTAAVACGRFLADDDTLSPRAALDVFMTRCNETLHNIGAVNTHFSVPDGFHDEEHYTTALDMLKISVHAMDYPLLMESADKPQVTAVFNSGETVYWQNSNLLIQESSADCYYLYARGLKTGMTDESGYCVSALATRFGHDVICVTMGAEASDIRWLETISLLDSSFAYIRDNIENTGE
ncbi:MAG: D-alanyl-D-alanine carboxypeptidase [Ruminococcus sp.]|jgi:D-alanyl-D-alanine carboxypeptidase (penicillin-binding protein 5/6)|nr:D-alanyl-D-alanine carboxypeptidase [Ruminococcus sp.]